MVCTFFGHRTITGDFKEELTKVLTELIVSSGANMFYVGNNGAFDRAVLNVLKELKSTYNHIDYVVVLAYFPDMKRDGKMENIEPLFPFGREKIHPKFAIEKRNRWMIDKAQVVVTYVLGTGGAEKFKNLAERKGKTVINIPDLKQEKPL